MKLEERINVLDAYIREDNGSFQIWINNGHRRVDGSRINAGIRLDHLQVNQLVEFVQRNINYFK